MVSSISGGASSAIGSFFSNRSASLFQTADTDGDGSLSLDEFKALGAKKTKGIDDALANLVASNDTDGDGSLSQSELQGLADKLQQGGLVSGGNLLQAQDGSAFNVQAFLKSADTDGNGKVSVDELKTALAPKDSTSTDAAFKAIDTDGDGKISLNELKASDGTQQADISGAGGAGGAHKGHHAHGGHGKGNDDDNDITATLDPLDTNGDGIVSEDELLAGTKNSSGASGNSLFGSSSKSRNNFASALNRTMSTLLSAQEQTGSAMAA